MIDVHHHFVPAEYRRALVESGNDRPDGMPAIPAWSEQQAIEFLDEMSIETAFLSISTPGVLLDGLVAADVARMVNDAAAGLIGAHPGRFGGFASLPLPDIDASLAEIERALDDLELDGVVLLTHYGSHYLGDPSMDPVLDELNRRKAVVFVHPTSPCGCEQTSLGLPRPILEFMFDTTRTVMNLIHTGTLDRCPDIQWIIPHAGAALPVLAARMEMVRTLAPGGDRESVATYLRRFHYDLAGPRTDEGLRALLGIADPERVLYGSDWPFTPAPAVAGMLKALRHNTVLEAGKLDGVYRENALRLLPRVALGRHN